MSKKEKQKRWAACPLEEEYFGDDRKAFKAEQRIASAKDRSKYKKTDREKFERTLELEKEQKINRENLLKGRVLSIQSEGIVVAHEGTQVICKLRGLLKRDKLQMKNLVTVGDFVLYEEISPNEGIISLVEPRTSTLSRADNLSRRKEQLIASNIDQVIITTSVVSPPIKPFLIDRYIIAARKGNMQPIVVINKIDLLTDTKVEEWLRYQESEIMAECLRAYKIADISVIALSSATGEGIENLKEAMKNKTTVFSGQSGVGKSSLINAMTHYDLRTGGIVDKTKKGSHTTTTTNLLPLSFGGWCIDTPGIKSFGVWDLKKEELEQFFTEIHKYGKKCHFPDCKHLFESDCAVIKAVKKHKISPLRLDSYHSILATLDEEHVRR